MAVSPGFRIGAIAILAVLAGTLAALLLSNSSDEADAAAGQRTPARHLLLRAGELPGYKYFSPNWDGQPNPDIHCAPLVPADSTAEIDAWVGAFAPHGCYALFNRSRGRTAETFRFVPPLIGTGAIDAGRVEAAETGLGLAGLLLTVALDERVGPPHAAPAGPGDQAVRFRFENGFFRELSGGGPKTSALAWRSGGKLGVVVVGGLPTVAANDRKALALARRQHQRFAD